MEILKTVIERLSLFLTALIPGAAALLLFGLAYPDLPASFWHNDYLQYETKVAVVIASAFLVGWSTVVAFVKIRNGIVGGISGFFQFELHQEPEIKPWRDANWRALLSSHLGKAAPADIPYIFEETIEIQLRAADGFPEPERSHRITQAYLEKAKAELNDLQWAGWWRHLHATTLFGVTNPMAATTNALTASFQTASILVLCGSLYFPTLRHWWIYALCASWLIILVWEGVGAFLLFRDPFSSLSGQMAYLRDKLGREAPPAAIQAPDRGDSTAR